MSMPITQHFDIAEFQSHDGVDYPQELVQPCLLPLCQMLEIFRAASGGRAVTIVSGYRTPAHNAAVGGAAASRHMAGDAADIRVEGMAPSDVHTLLLELFDEQKIEIGGLGIYPEWVHVDLHWVGHLRRWLGTGVGSEQTG